MDCWRLVLHDGRPAAYNMAVDESILTAYAAGDIPPTLRLYGWERPAISLGYFQDIERSRLDLHYCEQAGVDVVRRPTGGRAVLHGHDLTFSVAVGDDRIPSDYQGVLGSHVWLMRGIVAGLGKLGLDTEIGPESRSKAQASANADCFAHVAECDVRSADGAKIAGAAQVRRSGALLEQGSVPHVEPVVDYGRIFGGIEASPACVLRGIPRRTIEQAIVEGFSKSLGIAFEIWDLTHHEVEFARDLEIEKYASADWTYSRGCVDKSMLSCYTDRATLRGVRNHAQENPRR